MSIKQKLAICGIVIWGILTLMLYADLNQSHLRLVRFEKYHVREIKKYEKLLEDEQEISNELRKYAEDIRKYAVLLENSSSIK